MSSRAQDRRLCEYNDENEVIGRTAVQKELSSTLEDYLEAIFRIEKKKRAARVRDIAGRVGVTKSTVNAALKSLATQLDALRAVRADRADAERA